LILIVGDRAAEARGDTCTSNFHVISFDRRLILILLTTAVGDLFSGNGDFFVTGRQYAVYCLDNQGNMILYPGPTCRHQDNDADFTTLEILLIPKILVRGDESVEAFGLSAPQQFSVWQVAPPSLEGRLHDVINKMIAQGDWRSLVEQ
jgi:hypothetical protein